MHATVNEETESIKTLPIIVTLLTTYILYEDRKTKHKVEIQMKNSV